MIRRRRCEVWWSSGVRSGQVPGWGGMLTPRTGLKLSSATWFLSHVPLRHGSWHSSCSSIRSWLIPGPAWWWSWSSWCEMSCTWRQCCPGSGCRNLWMTWFCTKNWGPREVEIVFISWSWLFEVSEYWSNTTNSLSRLEMFWWKNF